jgi:hypothetical protein
MKSVLPKSWTHGFLFDLGNRRINNQDLIQSANSRRWLSIISISVRLSIQLTLKLVRHSRLYIVTLKSTLQMRKRTVNIGAILRLLTKLASSLPIAPARFDECLFAVI